MIQARRRGAAAVLTVAQHYRADAAAAHGGVAQDTLMEAAGEAVAREIAARWSPRRVLILCGPGDNGGDGYVVARRLAERGWPVDLASFAAAEGMKGAAALAAARWDGPEQTFSADLLGRARLVVDALFGAGLSRPLDGMVRQAIEAVRDAGVEVVAIDTPSGVIGDTGAVAGVAAEARLTVSFFRPKPAHLLTPARALCGEVAICDIGTPEAALDGIGPTIFRNLPPLWLDAFPWPGALDHKYTRGHLVVEAGPDMTGAARLAARAARRMGCGLVTVACQPDQMLLFQLDQPGLLVDGSQSLRSFETLLRARKRNALVIGPGAGVSVRTGERTIAGLDSGLACVLDADALSVFAQEPEVLFRALQRAEADVVFTPHDGEFARLFPDLTPEAQPRTDKGARAAAAAKRAGAVLIYKGADTVVAAPDGRVVLAGGAPADLATGGTGDVLSGFVGGLRALGMPAFEAACAACWMQAGAARRIGPGLIAEDLPDAAQGVLADLRNDGWIRDDPFRPAA